uniref:Sel1 repeat-containing protein 1 n=1 Tax=Anthurium amnicola TaxID=1678845 RepID=A0A1D1Y896_9ARAE
MRAWGGVGDGVLVLPHPAAAGGPRSPPPVDLRLLSVAVSPDFGHLWSHKNCYNICWPKIGVQMENRRMRSFKVKALENYGENQAPIAPLKFESPTGQLLSQILQTHPHLFPAAVDQQLEQFQSDNEVQKEKISPTSQDALYRRIAEVKEKERHKALEEIIYCMVIQKFMENGISMIPTIAPSSDPTIQVDAWPNQERKLEAVHSQDALDMIESHISLILGERSVGPLNTVGQISKIKLGKLYAASIMYGYFLKRVDERFQLERTMKTLPLRTDNRETIFDSLKANPLWDVESLVQIPSDEDDDIEGGGISGADEKSKSSRLRSYVMYFDAETLQRYATIRSKEAISLIEKQTQALFGRPDIRVAYDGSIEIPNDEIISITFSGLTMLVLEAVAFGSFLWDAEVLQGELAVHK